MSFNVDQLKIDFTHQEGLVRAKNLLSEQGCFIATGLLEKSEIATIQDWVASLIGLRRKSAGMASVASVRHFDEGMMEMVERNRGDLASISEGCKKLLPVHQLAVSSKFCRLSQYLMNTSLIIASPEKRVCVELPEQSSAHSDWHQDFQYSPDSDDGLVYWFPLQDIDESTGCLWTALGTHRLGQLRVKTGSDAIADLSFLENTPVARLTMKVGDLCVFNSMLAQRTSENKTRSARWSVQFRHGNFSNDSAIKKGWANLNQEIPRLVGRAHE